MNTALSLYLPLASLLFLTIHDTRATSSAASDGRADPVQNVPNDDDCHHTKTLPEARSPARLNFDLNFMIEEVKLHVEENLMNFSTLAEKLLSARNELVGILLSSSANRPLLALNASGRVAYFRNRTEDTEMYWGTLNSVEENGWLPPFKDCRLLLGTWLNVYIFKAKTVAIGLFLTVKIDQCDDFYAEYVGRKNKCDRETTTVSI